MEDVLDRLQSALSDRYTVKHELGAGGMATVYLAEDLKHHRQVAIKVLKPELAASLGAERFLREIEIAAQLSHPNILTLIDSGTADGLLYYVMPFVEGESLRDRLEREKQLPIEDALQITSEVADALGYAHSLGIVHRDVKPENILFESGHAVVADFGIARAVTTAGGERLTDTGLAVGTPTYMSPEQATGNKDIDSRSDVYSLGCVLYEMLGGDPPFLGSTPQVIIARKSAEAAPSLKVVRRRVTDSVEYAVATALETTPADRFATVSQFVEALRAPAPPRHARGPSALSLPVVAGIYVGGSVVVLAAVYLLVLQLGLPYWVLGAAAVLVVMFLPLTLVTGTAERRRMTVADVNSWGAGSGSRLKSALTWRRAGIAMAVAFGLLGLTTAGYSAMRSMGIGPVGTLMATGVLPERPQVIVADFENRTSDSGLGATVTEMFRIGLSQSWVVRPLDGTTIARALRRMERDPAGPLNRSLALEVAEREGVPAVAAGAIGSLGGRYILSVRLIATADSADLVSLLEAANDEGELFAAIDRITRQLRERIGEPLRSVRQSEPLEQVTTPFPEALRKHTEAVRVWNRDGDWERARGLLEEAVEIDTAFASAYGLLAAGYQQIDGSWSRWLEAITAAFRHRDRMPGWERLYLEAEYYGAVEFDRAKAVAVLEEWHERDPQDGGALMNLSNQHLLSREWAAAEHYAMMGIEMDGDEPNSSTWWNLVEAQAGQGRYEEASRSIDEFAEVLPGQIYPTILRAWLAAAQHDSERGLIHSDSLSETIPGFSLRSRGGADLVRGRFASARRYLEAAAALADPPSHRDLINLARIALRSGDEVGAIEEVEEVLTRYPLDSLAPDDRPYLELAVLYSEAGRVDRARDLFDAYRSEVHEVIQRGQPLRHGAEGAIALAEGRAQDAIVSYRTQYAEDNFAARGLYELGRAYETVGEVDSAVAVYERAVHTPGLRRGEGFTLGPTYERLCILFGERGGSERGIEYCDLFIELWEEADPEVQPRVEEARDRLARLVGEP